MQRIPKVVIYLVQRGQLLVFEHPDAPNAGLQVPAGTVKPGEEPRVAATRELREESGIDAVIVRLLGTARYDMTAYGRTEIHERSFVLAEPQGDLPLDRRWRHHETHDGIGEPDVFELYWVPLDIPGLAARLEAGQGALLGDVVA
jgi:8-oxo-dGTP pyrophosphatase MutT (NUDIX family)